MTSLDCACGYQAETPADLGDHLGEAFIPRDDIAPDGQVHAEAARAGDRASPAALSCLCGYITADATGMDEHLIRVFTPGDGICPDGRRHSPGQGDGRAGKPA
jgi:hypothetical protein